MSSSQTPNDPTTPLPDFESWTCPIPLQDYPTIVLGHGGGGKLSADLIKHLFFPVFENPALAQMGDAAVLLPNGAGHPGVAISTDSFTVTPLFFPGGDIGKLAVHGTINDVAMVGARPQYLSAAFILEEGLPLEVLGRVAESMASACHEAGVVIVTGDTKVVDKGHGDGVFINTTGIGQVPPGVDIRADHALPGDMVIVSGDIGVHGIAILSMREGLEFETVVESDTAALYGLVAEMLDVTTDIHCMRDPTRGGLAASLNEIAEASRVGIEIDETAVPVPPAVRAACEMLGLDPFYIANEGKLVAILPAKHAEQVLARMRSHPLGRRAAIVGEVHNTHHGMVVARTGIGGRRVVDML
ncbi:MAG: hydrogenase expression/formation protein HypE, partial [Anaerolineales bacterium]|nr:hydrogenase expression/formation protein HypE [Anaerolineales bacterium]